MFFTGVAITHLNPEDSGSEVYADAGDERRTVLEADGGQSEQITGYDVSVLSDDLRYHRRVEVLCDKSVGVNDGHVEAERVQHLRFVLDK